MGKLLTYFIFLDFLLIENYKEGALRKDLINPNWHSDIVTRSKMRVVAKSVSDVVTTLLYDVVKMLPQRCCNVATTSINGCVGAF